MYIDIMLYYNNTTFNKSIIIYIINIINHIVFFLNTFIFIIKMSLK